MDFLTFYYPFLKLSPVGVGGTRRDHFVWKMICVMLFLSLHRG